MAAVASVLAAWTLWVHLAEFGALPEHDSHIFLIVAKQFRYGLLPYRDLWELKPPGIFYYIRGIFAVLPEALWSVRFVDFGMYLAVGTVFYGLSRRETGWPFALIGTAAWLYVSHHYLFNLGGLYTEEYAAMAAIVAVACAATYAASGRLWWVLGSGLAVATAALFKHPGAAALVPATILVSRRPAIHAYALLLVAAASPIALVVAYFWYRGALDDFLECNLWALVVHGHLWRVDQALVTQRLNDLITQGRLLFDSFPFLTGALLIGVPVALLRPTWLRVAALLWVAVDGLGVAAQRQFAQHHFILTFPSICLLGTLALGWVLQPRAGERWFIMLPRVALCAVGLWFAVPGFVEAWSLRLPVVRQQWQRLITGPSAWAWSPAREFETRIGTYVRERTEPTDAIHVQGFGPTLLGVYWVADRRVATRYFYEPPFPFDQTQALAELAQSQPAYVVVASFPPYLYLMPWLMKEYSIETTKWHNYRADIWVRTRSEGFGTGTSEGLEPGPQLGGLALTLPPRADTGNGSTPLAEPRRGRWTSPVLPVRSDDGKVFIDWNPRSDLAWNPTGHGLTEVDATFSDTSNDVRALLGVATKRGVWSAWPRRHPQTVTVRLGHQTVIDRVTLVPGQGENADAGCEPALVAHSTAATGAQSPGEFQPVAGNWERLADGTQTYRFPATTASAVQVTVTPGSCGTQGGLRRIRVRPSGMGITVQYRSGIAAQLERSSWQTLEEKDGLLWVTAVPNGYIQVRYELWSDHAGPAPILLTAQVGNIRFQPDH